MNKKVLFVGLAAALLITGCVKDDKSSDKPSSNNPVSSISVEEYSGSSEIWISENSSVISSVAEPESSSVSSSKDAPSSSKESSSSSNTPSSQNDSSSQGSTSSDGGSTSTPSTTGSEVVLPWI